MNNLQKAAIANARLYLSEKETGKRRVAKASFENGGKWMLDQVILYLSKVHSEKFINQLVDTIYNK